MRRSTIWFVLAVAWAIDCVLSLLHHNRQQMLLTALFATAFLVAGLAFRAGSEETSKRPKAQENSKSK